MPRKGPKRNRPGPIRIPRLGETPAFVYAVGIVALVYAFAALVYAWPVVEWATHPLQVEACRAFGDGCGGIRHPSPTHTEWVLALLIPITTLGALLAWLER
jgi:hypothetical protein